MRSLLFVPGDSPRKLSKAVESGADALLVDLEDSVAPEAKPAARRTAAAFIAEAISAPRRPRLYVRVNALATGLADDDLDAIIASCPDGVVLPKSAGGIDITHLDAKIAVREAIADVGDGSTRILAIATESAASLFGLGSYRGASRRLVGLAWGAEDLSADIGATANRDATGRPTEPFRLARSLCLFGAVAAAVQPIDAVYPDYRNLEGLRDEAVEAARDGFTGKMAIHPAQVAPINAVFTPSEASLAEARRIVEAFAAAPGAGVIGLDGAMLDKPHLVRAQALLARAAAFAPA